MKDSPPDERWSEIAPLLGEALERPPAQRAAFLDDACAGDPDLRREVDAYLDAEDEAPDFLDGSVTDVLTARSKALAMLEASFASAPPSRLASCLEDGRQVGAYRLTGRIESGGMSTVYRAERADGQFERTVAVKVLRGAVGPGGDLRRRFETEQRILASLSHPHVAQVFDSGVLSEGQPYFVMEYVEGRPITVHCEERELDLEARLALFDRVAGAVQHAHQNMVVHRDLKPSNILVTPEGEPKLLDFGIAKLLGERAPEGALRTHTGALLLTPAYAAPEQVRSGEVSAATDTYALGVLLYELLAGGRPYRVEEQNPLEIARVVCEEHPARPSVAARERAASAEPDGREEGPWRPWHPSPRALRGDLDAIVMKALRKEPERRYATAAALRDDLERYRTGRPVRARAGTWSYRASRFVRRYRWSLAAGLAFLLLLGAYAATVTVQSRRIAEERDRAEATAGFLKDMLSISDPETGQGGATPARVLLQKGAAQLDTSFAAQPQLRADLKDLIGSAFRGYGLYEKALALNREALALRRAQGGSESHAVADALNNIGEVFYYLGRPDSAEVYYRRALSISRRLADDYPLEVAQSLNNLAILDAGREDYARAGERFEKALSIFRAHLPADHWRIANVLNNLAATYGRAGRLEKSERRYREALAMHRRVNGDVHRDVARAQAGLGDILTRQGKYAEAEAALEEAHSRARRATTDSSALTAHTLADLGELRQQQGDFAEAERYCRAARGRYRAALPPDHRRQARVLLCLGKALLAQDRPGEARLRAEQSLDIYEKALSERNERTIAAQNLLGAALTAGGRYEEAERPLLKSRDALREPQTPKEERTRRETRERLAQLYDAWGKSEKAAHYRRVLAASG